MKICILSMQNVQNMGSLLQSYSLKKTLETMGHEVSFLPIEPRCNDDLLMGAYRNSLSSEVQSSKFTERLKRLDSYFINRLRMKKRIKEQTGKYEGFRKNILGMCPDLNPVSNYDCCVIGSDEVFNCLDDSPWGFTTQLFGNVKETDHVITYAASCGATIADQIPEKAKEKINLALSSLVSVSVRDKNTQRFVREISGRDSEINLDPVLIGNFDDEVSSSENLPDLPARFCVVYAYYNRIYKKQEIDAINRFCMGHDLVPIAVGMPQFWIKNYIVADPFQCLAIFKGASFVITDTFHGTIFSAKYCPRFATVVRDSNRNKLQDLIERIQIPDHQISAITIDELEKAYKRVHDKKSFDKLMAEERERTLLYLNENLKSGQRSKLRETPKDDSKVDHRSNSEDLKSKDRLKDDSKEYL